MSTVLYWSNSSLREICETIIDINDDYKLKSIAIVNNGWMLLLKGLRIGIV